MSFTDDRKFVRDLKANFEVLHNFIAKSKKNATVVVSSIDLI